MRRGQQVQFLTLLVWALGCEQLLGIEYTEQGGAERAAGAGGLGGNTNAVSQTHDGGAAGGGAGIPDVSPPAGDAGAGGEVDVGPQGGSGGVAGTAGATAGTAGSADAGGVAGDSQVVGHAGSGGQRALTLSPSELPPGSVSLWLDASVGVIKSSSGKLAWWQDRARGLIATPSSEARAPEPLSGAFGEYPGVFFDGENDRLVVPDAAPLRMGSEPFVLALVVRDLAGTCCQQMVYTKQNPDYPYAGVSVAVNLRFSFDQELAREFTTFLTLNPDVVSTPATEPELYRGGKTRVVTMLRTATELSIRVNGQLQDSIASEGIDASASGVPLYIGGHPVGDDLSFHGLLAEIILARGLSVDEALALDRSLLAKYASALAKPY
ncbi:MAG TPA: hypothetical protein VJV79_17780 [Polyangiaceae bacterium]|nr:hypothetical protein [Polyangiaceae bacterium]